jgi:hypothetical protein
MLADPNGEILKQLIRIADALSKPSPSPWVEWLKNAAANFVGSLVAAMFLVSLYVFIQWFLAATDIVIGYNWRFDGDMNQPHNIRPHFDIRNRSRSRTYFLASVGYLIQNRPVASFDKESVWGVELRPGTIHFVEVAPVKNPPFTSLGEALGTEVHVYLQNGRVYWLKGQGPGQLRTGRIQKAAFWLRSKLENAAMPTE